MDCPLTLRMFYAARTFAFKLGQRMSILLLTALATIGGGEIR